MTVWVLIGGYRVFADREVAIRKMKAEGWGIDNRKTSAFVLWFEQGFRSVAVQSLYLEQ